MNFKIGDKIQITDGSFSIELRNNKYDKGGVRGDANIIGIVLAVDCRLPFVPTFPGTDSNCPTDGVTLTASRGRLYNDLLVQTDGGFVFISSECVKLADPPKYYAWIFGSIKMEITKKQYDEIEEAEKTIAGHLIPGLLEVENE